MGWLVKTKTEKKGNEEVTKYRIWTTVSDGWITEWSTKEEIATFFFWENFIKFMEKFIEDSTTFPHKYHDKDTHEMFICEKEADEFYKFHINALRSKNYNELLSKKFYELIKEKGITVKVSDGEYGFDSNDNEEVKESISDVVTNDPKYLLGVLKNIESNMSKDERKRKSNVSIVKDYLMCHTSKGGRTSSYEMCEYLGIDGDGYTFKKTK